MQLYTHDLSLKEPKINGTDQSFRKKKEVEDLLLLLVSFTSRKKRKTRWSEGEHLAARLRFR